jgi:hypothetical protein
MTQLTLDDAAAFAREAAIQRVHEAATLTERDIVRNALDAVIARRRAFTSEDVINELGEAYATIREPRLLGAIIRIAAKEGRIIAGAYVPGTRAERHKAPIRTWHVAPIDH